MSEAFWEEPATAWVHLTLQQGMFARARRGPWVRIDGEPVATAPGDNVIPVTAGRHALSVVSERRLSSPVTTHVEVGVGETARLFYTPPFSRLSSGNLGPEPQPFEAHRYLGLVALVIVVGMVFQTFFR